MSLSSITHFNRLQEDALFAIRSRDKGQPELFDHPSIVNALEQAATAFPPTYERAMRQPLLDTFRSLGPRGWANVLDSDPNRQRAARLGLDLVQAIVQRADPDVETATLALQEVINDLYDGYLSAADRAGVKAPDHSVLAPLVKWGQPRGGPYIWPAPAAAGYGCGTGVVSMPPAFATGGLAAWSALGHEGAGHAILHADEGLHDELARKVHDKIWQSRDAALRDEGTRRALAVYWSRKIDETASDVLGILNMGPAAAVGLLAYFRALRPNGRLLPHDTGSPHPTDIARGYLAAAAVGHCAFDHRNAWRQLLTDEVNRDVPPEGLWLDNVNYPADVVRVSAGLAALAIMNDRVRALEDHSITEIQNWTNEDNRIVQLLCTQVFMSGRALPQAMHSGVYAAHGVAAAILVSLLDGRISTHQARMIEMLGTMHRSNVAWTGLAFSHAGGMLPPHVVHTSATIGTQSAGAATEVHDGDLAMDRMMALALAYQGNEADDSEDDAPGSDIIIPLGFAEPFGSSINLPFGLAARRHGLDVKDGTWRLKSSSADIPLCEGLSSAVLDLILGTPG